jgi:hypothetical protein
LVALKGRVAEGEPRLWDAIESAAVKAKIAMAILHARQVGAGLGGMMP